MKLKQVTTLKKRTPTGSQVLLSPAKEQLVVVYTLYLSTYHSATNLYHSRCGLRKQILIVVQYGGEATKQIL